MLRERIAVLERALVGDDLPPLEFGLTPQEGRLFGLLMHRTTVTKDSAMAVLYRDFAKEEADLKIVDVFICRMRKKLAPFGIKIATRWGQGYELPSASKEIARGLLPVNGAPA